MNKQNMIRQAKRLINRIEAYEVNASYVLADEYSGLMEAANSMFKSGDTLTALRHHLSKGAVPTGSDLASLTLTTGDDTLDDLLAQIKRAKNTAFRLGNGFAKKASNL
jgi:hypothetical protein